MATDLSGGSHPLQSWTCVKCGAALPAEAATGAVVTCGYCGTEFKVPMARSGGVSISGESITIGGDIVGGSKRVIVTSEVPSAATIWDEPDTSDDEGISIEGDGIQVRGDVVGGSVVKIVQPASTVKAEPVAAVAQEVVAEPVKPTEPEAPLASAPKLGWWEKIKRSFSN